MDSDDDKILSLAIGSIENDYFEKNGSNDSENEDVLSLALDSVEQEYHQKPLTNLNSSNKSKTSTKRLVPVDLSFDESIESEISLPKDQADKVTKSLVHAGDTDSSDDEDNKYFESSRYDSYGKSIKQLQKNSAGSTSSGNYKDSSWKEKLNNKFCAPDKSQSLKESNEISSDPFFGIRIVNPIISSQTIKEKMCGRTTVSFAKIRYHVSHGDLKSDWVIAGVIVRKHAPKVSQKGSNYSSWVISDLKNDLKTVSMLLFGKAHQELWKTPQGTVLAILNPSVLGDDQKSDCEAKISIVAPDQIMIWGKSKDLGNCKSKKKNGEPCSYFVNLAQCEFCVYHVKQEYNKSYSGRGELQFSANKTALRNKVLGKNEVFYAGKSFTSVNPIGKKKRNPQDDTRLLGLGAYNKLSETKPDTMRIPQLQRSNNILKLLPSVNNPMANNKLSDKRRLQNLCEENLNGNKTSLLVPDNSTSKAITDGKSNMSSAEKTTQSKIKKHHKVEGETISTKSKNAEQTKHPGLQKIKDKTFDKAILNLETVTKSSPALSKPDSDFFFNVDVPLKVPAACSQTQQKTSTKNLKSGCIKKTDLQKRFKSLMHVHPEVGEKINPSIPVVSELIVRSMSSKTDSTSNQPIMKDSKVHPSNKIEVSSKCPLRKESVTTTSNLSPPNSSCDSSIARKPDYSSRPDSISLNRTPVASQHKLSFSENSQETSMPVNSPKPVTPLPPKRSSITGPAQNKRVSLAKLKALAYVKNKGPITKENVEEGIAGEKKGIKRPYPNSPEEKVDNSKPVLSERFIQLMNQKTTHEDLVQIRENEEEIAYFNKMEKKDQLEAKMLSTFKIECKAVKCLKCSYVWFSASDSCKAEGHPLKVIDTVKRFFKCGNCDNRTVSLTIIPLIPCKKCSSTNWIRAPMIREKIAKCSELSIRGGEQAFVNSVTTNGSLNLLVPD